MKKMVKICLIVTSAAMSRSCGSEQESKIQAAFHTPTYGIISFEDIENVASITQQKPFIPGESSGIARWQCYPTEHLQRSCEDGTLGYEGDYLDDFKSANISLLVPNMAGHIQIFFPQGARDFKECPLYLRSLDAFLKKDSHVCFETHYYFGEKDIPLEARQQYPLETKASHWELWQFKNKSGYWQDREPTKEESAAEDKFWEENDRRLAEELSEGE